MAGAMLSPWQLKNKSFLLLEDSKITRHIVKGFILKYGGYVDSYENLKKQNEILGNRYDYAIVDLRLGDRTSIDFIPLLKKTNPNIRVIVQTGSPEQLKKDFQVASQIDFLIEKPVTDSKLEKAISSSLYQPLKGKQILIVEDARISLRSLVRIVMLLGGIPHAYSSLDKESEFLKIQYDFALLDLILRKENTLRLMKKLRSTNPYISIFVLSSTPALLQNHPEIMQEVSYIFQKPVNDSILEKHLIRSVEQPDSDRRSVPRKPGDAGGNLWIAPWNKEFDKPDLFESPHLIDISNMGLSFQSRLSYSPGDHLLVWLLHQPKNQEMQWLELRGVLRWTQPVKDDRGENLTRYGISLEPELSKNFNELQLIVPKILDIQ